MATIRTTTTSADGATIIGESVQIRGTLSGDEDLHVLGRVDGRIELQRTLVVAESGIVKAEVSVKNAVISGVVVGNVHASESIEITREGRMVGDVFAPRVIIVDGASFRGNVDMGDIENMPARKPGTERPRPMPIAVPRPATATAARPRTTVPPRPATTAPPAPAATAPAAPRPAEQPKAAAALEPPAAKGLPQKANKTRVIVKRK
jgi:cytoskeletal protein CcmA (bactofilin family)